VKTTVTKRDLAELMSNNPEVKYVRAKRLLAIARKSPQRVYPHLEFFASLLKSENNILKWTAIDIMGYVSKVDKKKQVDRLLRQLYGFLEGGKLITANHAIGALANVALAKPEHRKRIIRKLLNTEHNSYETDECRNIALGKVVQVLGLLSTDLNLDDHVVQFIERQTSNPRPSTRKKAERFLRNIDKSHKTLGAGHEMDQDQGNRITAIH